MGNKSYCFFTSYREDFWGKDHGKKQELRKGLVSPVLHFLSGMGEWGCEVGLPWPCPLLCQNLQVGRGAWCGLQVELLRLSGLLVWTKGSAHIRNAVWKYCRSTKRDALFDHSLAFLGPLSLECDSCFLRRLWGRWDTSECRTLVGEIKRPAMTAHGVLGLAPSDLWNPKERTFSKRWCMCVDVVSATLTPQSCLGRHCLMSVHACGPCCYVLVVVLSAMCPATRLVPQGRWLMLRVPRGGPDMCLFSLPPSENSQKKERKLKHGEISRSSGKSSS